MCEVVPYDRCVQFEVPFGGNKKLKSLMWLAVRVSWQH